MNEPRFGTWRYRLGDGSGPAGIGVTLAGEVELVSEQLALRQSILLLMATVPGERVMRPAYGCPLDRLAFAPNDDTTAGLAIYTVRAALERWEPRVEILTLDAGRDPDDVSKLLIQLSFRAKTSAAVDAIAFTIPVAG